MELETNLLNPNGSYLLIGQRHYIMWEYDLAYKYFKLAAKQGDLEAEYQLGKIYSTLTWANHNSEESIKHYKSAFERGYKLRNDTLHILIFPRINFVKNAANKNFKLGQQYDEMGKHNLSVKYYKLAADKDNDVYAQYVLGCRHFNGYAGDSLNISAPNNVPSSYKKSVMYYQLASKQKYAPAQYRLGVMYYWGYWVKINYKKAVKYFILAAKQGENEAQYHAGTMYYEGLGVKQNYKKAIKYYELAAQQHNEHALYQLAFLYSQVDGVKRNYEAAAKFLELTHARFF
ncbi:MAG: sel1 repeat family protein [Mycoplasmataceae bacterium]|nr:sel1 repeat family protein [Mycoplasmataceae bacterium]